MTRLVPLCLAALALAACGSDEGEEEATPAATSAQTVEVTGTDFALEPATVELGQAGTYTLAFRNDGQTGHALKIDGQGVEEETETIGPGETAELTVELQGGEYEMYCPVDGHRGFGMEGTVLVGGAAAGGGGTTEDQTTTEDDGGGYRY